MNDFLRNLRSSHKKETPPQQKNTDTRFYAQHDRRMVRDRRAAPPPSVDPVIKQINDHLPELIDATSIIAEQLERLASIQERVAESEIQKNKAVADFVDGIEALLQKGPAPKDFTSPPKATASYASGTHYTKDDILSIINTMRDQGATYAVIAEYLREKGIPHLFGQGEWHAQTIHRLCR